MTWHTKFHWLSGWAACVCVTFGFLWFLLWGWVASITEWPAPDLVTCALGLAAVIGGLGVFLSHLTARAQRLFEARMNWAAEVRLRFGELLETTHTARAAYMLEAIELDRGQVVEAEIIGKVQACTRLLVHSFVAVEESFLEVHRLVRVYRSAFFDSLREYIGNETDEADANERLMVFRKAERELDRFVAEALRDNWERAKRDFTTLRQIEDRN